MRWKYSHGRTYRSTNHVVRRGLRRSIKGTDGLSRPSRANSAKEQPPSTHGHRRDRVAVVRRERPAAADGGEVPSEDVDLGA